MLRMRGSYSVSGKVSRIIAPPYWWEPGRDRLRRAVIRLLERSTKALRGPCDLTDDDLMKALPAPPSRDGFRWPRWRLKAISPLERLTDFLRDPRDVTDEAAKTAHFRATA